MPVMLRKNIRRGMLATLLLMIVIGVISFLNIVNLVQHAQRLTHTQTVLTRLESLMALATDAETGQRGYLITGDEAFLEPYTRAMQLVAADYAQLRHLTVDDAHQQRQLDAIKPVLDARLASLAEVIEIHRREGRDAAIEAVRSAQGKHPHDQLRVQVDAMVQYKTTLHLEREQQVADSVRLTLTVIVLGNLLGLALIGLSLRQVLRDMKRRDAAEQALQQSNTELSAATARALESDQLKSAFLATMSHELRTPLNSIIGFTGILRQGLAGPLNPEQAKQLDMVQGSARHLLALINDVLDLSKIEAGEMQLDRAAFDLRATIDNAVASVLPLARKKGLTLNCQIAPAVGTMVSDRRRVQQIVINLLSNAIKFTDHGAVALDVDVLAPDAGVRLRVRDSGIGIKPEDLAVLFRPFRQLENGLARQFEGTGLGLSICQRLVDMMGGKIAVKSQWGQGSTFSVTLPLTTQEASGS